MAKFCSSFALLEMLPNLHEKETEEMKTAEDWCERQIKDPEANAVDWVKQIQLDAYKAGMTEAAEMLVKESQYKLTPDSLKTLWSKRILSARDNKKDLEVNR